MMQSSVICKKFSYVSWELNYLHLQFRRVNQALCMLSAYLDPVDEEITEQLIVHYGI
jgi:hypothetical protein